MTSYYRNPYFGPALLPVDIVFHPSRRYRHAGITFDEVFFHPGKRVEAEKQMENEHGAVRGRGPRFAAHLLRTRQTRTAGRADAEIVP